MKKSVSLNAIDYRDNDSLGEDYQEEKYEEYKNNECNKWKKKIKEDCKIFNASIEKWKVKWLVEREKEWNVWIEFM
ncbi:tryptophan-rich antigen [Plasmodium malariae]|uniref:Tryptophan-rich antigen n=1 Tax=Plasmodium malariae TaxID=5858 RepID=A0A1A8X4G8_PLAMA|nr:tryptophan-rich antigen [Plasmodium malariae]